MRISFCNDCDLMTRAGFEQVHAVLGSLGMPAGDSFWLFDPSGGDMALFTYDVEHPGPQQSWLLDQLNAGTIDVLHSAGSYGERFNRGFRPQRSQIERALEYLAKHARVPRIWTNHGDVMNTQNIGGSIPSEHHHGDQPGSPEYCLDLLVAHGVTYFWLDRLLSRDPDEPYRVVAAETARDGRSIMTFTRYCSPQVAWSPNGQNFDQQLDEPGIGMLVRNRQDTVLYTHWGCHHTERHAHAPNGEALTRASRLALERLSRQLSDSGVTVTRLLEVLEQRPADVDELQRVGSIVVRDEVQQSDTFYFNQFHKHGAGYFSDRIAGLAVSGRRALDAGCGVGQWSFALREHFDEVYGVELAEAPLGHARRIARAMRVDYPEFTQGSIEQLPFPAGHFDFVFCYGVLFVTNVDRTLAEFARVLQPGRHAYVCLNGDGWYEYLCDERFKDQPVDSVWPFAEPLWNALVARLGGEARFDALWDTGDVLREPSLSDPERVRADLVRLGRSATSELTSLLEGYSDRVIMLLGWLLRRHRGVISSRQRSRRGMWAALSKGLGLRERTLDLQDEFPSAGIGASNRPFTPDEFKRLVRRHGFEMVAHGPDAALSSKTRPVRPIYDGVFNGHDSVWECLLERVG